MFERQNYVLRDQYNSNDDCERKRRYVNIKQHSCTKCFFNVEMDQHDNVCLYRERKIEDYYLKGDNECPKFIDRYKTVKITNTVTYTKEEYDFAVTFLNMGFDTVTVGSCWELILRRKNGESFIIPYEIYGAYSVTDLFENTGENADLNVPKIRDNTKLDDIVKEYLFKVICLGNAGDGT